MDEIQFTKQHDDTRLVLDFRKEWMIQSHGINPDMFKIIAGITAPKRIGKSRASELERDFFNTLRREIKAHHRRTHHTSAATRTMSKRKRAGSKRWPASLTRSRSSISIWA